MRDHQGMSVDPSSYDRKESVRRSLQDLGTKISISYKELSKEIYIPYQTNTKEITILNDIPKLERKYVKTCDRVLPVNYRFQVRPFQNNATENILFHFNSHILIHETMPIFLFYYF